MTVDAARTAEIMKAGPGAPVAGDLAL